MKKMISILASLLLTSFLLFACNSHTSASNAATSDSTNKDNTTVTTSLKDSIPATNQKALLAASEIYTCSMHQEVIGEKPGHCSICGMELVKQKPTDKQKKLIQEGNYTKPKE